MKRNRRIFVVRHLTRDKKHPEDPQTPTMMGEVEALTMGVLLRQEWNAEFARCISSPQPRGTRTADLLLAGWAGYDQQPSIPDIETADGLDDFSSDERFQPLKAEFKAVKGATKIASEEALFLAGGEIEKLRQTKLAESIAVIDTIDDEGDVLVGGIHGANIDGLYAHYAKQLDENTPDGMLAFGRQIDKCEGFVLVCDDEDELTEVLKIERPAWLNAVSALIK